GLCCPMRWSSSEG
nr:RecName: Full=Snaclec ophioluxin subunit beta [Ophiophagus hannah]